MKIRRLDIFTIAILTGFIFINFEVVSGLYTSTLIFVIFVIYFEFSSFKRAKNSAYLWVIWLSFCFVFLAQYIFGSVGLGAGFLEFLKITLVLLGASGVITLQRRLKLDYLLVLPWVLSAYIVFTFIFLDWNYYDQVRQRFSGPSFGSPNSLGFVIAFALVSLCYYRKRFSNPIIKLNILVCSSILIAALLATQSRGAVIILITGIISIQASKVNKSLLILFVGLAIVVLSGNYISGLDDRANLIGDITETGGTGRILIWTSLFLDQIQSPIYLLFGRGPVEIPLFGETVTSAHSMVVQMMYGFGVVGIILFSSLLLKIWKHIGTQELTEERNFHKALFFMLFISLFLDSFLFNVQILWFSTILLALLLKEPSVFDIVKEKAEI